jgi:predicted SAM-dependent methyltransferase
VVCNVAIGLPFADGRFDCAALIHVLQDLAYGDVRVAIGEVYRVLRRGGVARLAVPDLDRAIDAYLRGEAGYFYVPDCHARSIGAKLITQITWYGSVRTPFTVDFLEELLHGGGFRTFRRCAFRDTGAVDRELTALDNRARETLFVEAVK